MAFTVGERTVRPLTADEVLRMVDLDVLPDLEDLELLDGALVEMNAKSRAHELVKLVVTEWLAPGIAARAFELRVETPILVPDRVALPEPDLSVVPRVRPFDFATTPLLVIEVAVSSVRTDTRAKPVLYARAGVPEYWVVEPEERRVHVYEDPTDAGFGRVSVLREEAGAQLLPRHVAVPPLPLATLFAEL